ncbi:MAG TPA: hypothetical protein V6D17_24595 [Candidatus Obscuribacterales bacterium]
MSQNFCHRFATESLFVAFATVVLTFIALAANTFFWPAVVLLFGVRAIVDFRAALKDRKATPHTSKRLAVC